MGPTPSTINPIHLAYYRLLRSLGARSTEGSTVLEALMPSTTSMRRALLGVAVGTMFLGLPRSSAGQGRQEGAPQGEAAAVEVSTPPSQPSTPTDDSSQTLSLGDLARIARAKKESEPKAVRVIDDENLPRNGGGISVVGSGSVSESARPPGKMTLLDFWASWCGPCRESVPDLKALARTYRPDQLEVISVNEDKNENAGRRFASENGMSWEVDFDPEGRTSRQYGVEAFPTFILMDSNGREVQRFVGEDPEEPLASRIAPFMPKGNLELATTHNR
jgi:thiol-disulfide isomerase/thioredoxin